MHGPSPDENHDWQCTVDESGQYQIIGYVPKDGPPAWVDGWPYRKARVNGAHFHSSVSPVIDDRFSRPDG